MELKSLHLGWRNEIYSMFVRKKSIKNLINKMFSITKYLKSKLTLRPVNAQFELKHSNICVTGQHKTHTFAAQTFVLFFRFSVIVLLNLQSNLQKNII